jgi:hypothetical protein
VFEYRTLLQKNKSNYYRKDGEIGYLLSCKWIDRWKEIVYYERFYRNLKPEFDPEKETHVGEIDNDSLIRPRSEFLNDVDENSIYNCILKRDVKMNYDYKPVDESIWNFFHSRYGGTEIKRFYHKTYSFGAEIEAKLKEFKFVVLPNLEEWDKAKISEPMSIFTSKHDTFNSLLERIVKSLSSDKYGLKLSLNHIRAWKLGYSNEIDEIDEQIKKARNEKMDVDDENPQTDSKRIIERNTGVEFPGTSLEMMRKFVVDDLELSSTDTLVLETASQETNKFIFYYEKIEILSYGKCEYCYSHKPLVVQCR